MTRFYAGCFSKGELPALVDRLEELLRDPTYKYTSYGRVLASMLLSDWVFSQHPRSMRKVIGIVLDGVRRRYFINSTMRYRRPLTTLLLPQRSGRDELIAECFSILTEEPSLDFARTIISILNENVPVDRRVEFCLGALTDKVGSSFGTWLMYSLYLRVLGRTDIEQITAIFQGRTIEPLHVDVLVRSGKTEVLGRHPEKYEMAIGLVLERRVMARRHRQARSWIDVLLACFGVLQQWRMPVSVGQMVGHLDAENDIGYELPVSDQIRAFARVVDEHARVSESRWSRTLVPWNEVVETGRREFRDAWAFFELAAQAAGIRSIGEKGNGRRDLFDKEAPLCERARYARLRAGNKKWWSDTLLRATDRGDRMFGTLVILSWASAKTIAANAEILAEYLREYNEDELRLIGESIRRIRSSTRSRQRDGLNISEVELGIDCPEQVIAALWPRLSRRSQDLCYESVIGPYRGNDRFVLGVCHRATVAQLKAGKLEWETALARISTTYGLIRDSDYSGTYYGTRYIGRRGMPRGIARSILDASESYPAELISAAEGVFRYRMSESVVPVIRVAKAQDWFGLG